jgi:hypothetical protein
MDWRFYLTYQNTRTQIEEPQGFDAIEFTLRRSTTYWGIEFLFTEALTFVGKGYKTIVQAYEYDGIDAVVEIELAYFVNQQSVFAWRGQLNYSQYKRDRGNRTVDVALMQSSFTDTFKNRIESAVNLESLVSIDGKPLPAAPVQNIRLHGKELLLQAGYRIQEFLSTFNLKHSSNGTVERAFYFTPPWEATLKDLDGYREPAYYEAARDYPIFYSGFTYPQGIVERQIKVEFRYKKVFTSTSKRFTLVGGQVTSNEGNLRFSLKVLDLDNVLIREYLIDTRANINTAGGYNYDSGVQTILAEMPANTKLVFEWYWEAEGLKSGTNVNGYQYILEGSIDTADSYLRLSETSIYPDSDCKSFLLFDALERSIAVSTGFAGKLRSDYLSPAGGSMGDLAATNGLNIRKMLDKAGSLFPITASFKDLFDGMDAIASLGMRIERDPDGSEFVRVEPKNYFFQKTRKHSYLNVNDLKITPAMEYIHNELEIGYQKWETEKTNGIDEFNSQRTFALPINSQKKKLSLLSKLITAGYIIEDTRRQQYAEAPTSDYKNDNDLFVIHVRQEQGKYVSVRGTGSDQDSNVFSPGTVYNAKLSPVRNFGRWRNYLAGTVAKKTDPKAVFTSGKGNYQAVLAGISENADQSLSGPALFFPEILEFTYPIRFAEFLQLQADSNCLIEVGCSAEPEYAGYILEVSYRPNTADAGICEFKLLRG